MTRAIITEADRRMQYADALTAVLSDLDQIKQEVLAHAARVREERTPHFGPIDHVQELHARLAATLDWFK